MYKVVYTSASQIMCRDLNAGRQGFMNGSLTLVSIEPSVLRQFQKGKKHGIFLFLQFGRQANGEGIQSPQLATLFSNIVSRILKNYNTFSKFIFMCDGIFCCGIYETQMQKPSG